MSIQDIGARPVGLIGRIAGRMMNLIHHHQYRAIISGLTSPEDREGTAILDVGCGGGIALRLFAEYFGKARLYGIDLSSDMVALSSRLNRSAIASGRMTVLNNSVERIQIAGETLDLVSVFDSINFWDDYAKAFSELRRVLRKDGRLLIVNGFPEVGSRWYDFVKFKSADEYGRLLSSNGFRMDRHEISRQMIVIEGVLS
jgi:ubiquinone/menaquinone biosynthesis C-methylase UbiE